MCNEIWNCMPTIFIPNSKGYARNFVHFSWINNVFYFLIIRFWLNFYLHSCNNFPRSLIFIYFRRAKNGWPPKIDFIFLFFFLEKLSIEFRGKKKGRRISTTESLRCARNSDREAEPQIVSLLFVSTASRRGCRKSSEVPHYPKP